MTAPSSRARLSPDQTSALKSRMRGAVLCDGDEGYEAARTIHNGMFDRRPAAIARCTGTADVMRALEFARARGLQVSVRSGGHGVPGFAVCDDGLTIDLSAMSAVRVDPRRRQAHALGGTTWGQFDHETQAFGLATTGGLVRTTGIAGLTLAGGHGFLARRFGLACDNLTAADVLTADGSLVRADAHDHADLFWALRGGGGNFGVVTAFEYQLHEVGPVLGGLLIAPFDRVRARLRFYDEYIATAPDELGLLAVLATLPDGTKALVHLVCYSGDLRKGEEVLQPLRTITSPIADQIQVMPYPVVQSIVENFNPPGMRNYWKTVYLQETSDEVCGILADLYQRVPAPHSHIVLYGVGGAISRVPDGSTAVAHRDARHIAIAIGMWESPADDEVNIAWVREVAEALQPFAAGGFYPNYDEAASAERLLASFGPEKYRRLTDLKRRYDPDNVFCLNQNIRPALV